jgi:hypothetical protein
MTMITTLTMVSTALLMNARTIMLLFVVSTSARFCQITHLVGSAKLRSDASDGVFAAWKTMNANGTRKTMKETRMAMMATVTRWACLMRRLPCG